MEKRKWLWKRKSSEGSPGETESSGSISSHSERYSDDQEAFKVLPNYNTQSPEVSSKASANSEDVNDSIRSLTEKLSAALVNVSAKEDLVKQHAKVAEEAIAGWETAENEVVLLKKKFEAAVQQNSALEDRVSHLDGALKECVRQLRQARDEQELKIQEAVTRTTQEWETAKFELESQLIELQTKAEVVRSEPSPRFSPDLWHRIEALEKENSALKLELSSQLEELEIRAIERDLSTQAAETASKQHLDSIKKVAKLEAECRRLKAIACKPSFLNDNKSAAASSIYVESLTDSQSDSGERLNGVEIDTQKLSGLEANKGEPSCSDSWASALIAELDQFKNEKVINRNLPGSSIEIDLMDDFLEMERLAALPETKSENRCLESKATARHSNDSDSSLKAELEATIHRTAELEEKLEKIEVEKAELEIALTKSQESLEASELLFRDTEVKLEELQRELCMANEAKQCLVSQLSSMEAESELQWRNSEIKLEELQRELSIANEARRHLESQLSSIAASELQLRDTEVELKELKKELSTANEAKRNLELQLSSITASELQLRDTEVKLEELERELSMANEAKRHLELQLSSIMASELLLRDTEVKLEELQRELSMANEAKRHLELQLNSITASELQLRDTEVKLEELQRELFMAEEAKRHLESQLSSKQTASELQLKDTEIRLEELQRELCMENEAKRHLESQLSRMETDAATMSAKIESLQAEIEKERDLLEQVSVSAKESKQLLESQLISIESESRMMSAQIDSLETEVEKERALSARITVKCRELEEELSRKRQEAELQQTSNSNVELKIKQEDLAVATGKLAECQKTIASLGRQLKSLATLEDFLIDTTSIPEFSRGGSLIPKAGGEPWRLHSNETYSPKRDPQTPRVSIDHSGPSSVNKNDRNTPPSSSSSSSIMSSSHASAEKNRNGFAKFFTRSKNGIQLEI